MSEVRGRAGRTPCLKGSKQPRGVIPRPRSGAAAKSTRLQWRRTGCEELPRIQAHAGRPGGVTRCPRSGAAAGRNYPTPLSLRPGAAAGRSNPHTRDQGRWPGGPTPRPRSRGCMGAGGARGAIPRLRSGRAAVRRYPSSKVRISGCALLEQP